MAALNIRNVDSQLLATLKAEAALLGSNLKSYVMAILVARVVPQPVGVFNGSLAVDDARRANERSGNGTRLPILQQAQSKPERLHPVQPLRGELAGLGDESAQLPQPGPASCKAGSCPHGKRNAAYCRQLGGGC